MQAEQNGYWYADVSEAQVGDRYRYLLTTVKGESARRTGSSAERLFEHPTETGYAPEIRRR
jgi:1,4-alpha-glucan branching enzyme